MPSAVTSEKCSSARLCQVWTLSLVSGAPCLLENPVRSLVQLHTVLILSYAPEGRGRSSRSPRPPLPSSACTSALSASHRPRLHPWTSCLHIQAPSTPLPYTPAHPGTWGCTLQWGELPSMVGREGAYGALRVGSGPLHRELRLLQRPGAPFGKRTPAPWLEDNADCSH